MFLGGSAGSVGSGVTGVDGGEVLEFACAVDPGDDLPGVHPGHGPGDDGDGPVAELEGGDEHQCEPDREQWDDLFDAGGVTVPTGLDGGADVTTVGVAEEPEQAGGEEDQHQDHAEPRGQWSRQCTHTGADEDRDTGTQGAWSDGGGVDGVVAGGFRAACHGCPS